MAMMPKWVFLTRIFWFPLGVVVGFHITQFKDVLVRLKWVFLVTAIACIPLGMLEWEILFRLSGRDYLNMRETILDSIYAIAFIFAILSVSNDSLVWNGQISDLGVKSFGIYLVHYTAMEYVAKLIYQFAPMLLGMQVVFQSIILIIGFAVPLALMYIVEKTFARRYFRYLFG
jgi:peptidoglycan/LPS O-acetylase OafA/YrhL